MKILVLAALFSYVAAAPSSVALPAAAPTIDPGDIQAAAIDAQVFAEDQARALAEKVIEENNEKVIESDSLVKEKQEEEFWTREDKKWQALDAVKTAEAQIDGAVANNAEAIARSALGGVIYPTYVAPQLFPTPIVRTPIIPGAPIVPAPLLPTPLVTAPFPSPLLPGPLIYATPGLVAKPEEKEKEMVKTAELEKDRKQEQKVEDNKDPEPEKPILKMDTQKPAENLEKPAENSEKPALPVLPLVAPEIKFAQPWATAPVYFPQPVLTPVLKQW